MSANKDRNSSTWARDPIGSHGVSKLSSTTRHGLYRSKCQTIALEGCFDGSNPKCKPMVVTKSPNVLADSHEMKCLTLYFSIMVGWCSAIIAKLVLPIPPGPSMATRAGSQRRLSTRSLSSYSRPWNICGEAGSREREPELSPQR
jgi:hypothetical protein